MVAKDNKKVDVQMYNLKAEKLSAIVLPESLYNESIDAKVFAQYIHVYLANQRQGTSSTLTRAEINASTKKIYRQKGTGNARHGSKRAPIFVGGGVTFAIKPRDFTLKMNKAQKKLALVYSITQKVNDNSVIAIDVVNASGKTSEFVECFKKLDIKKALFIVKKVENNNVIKGLRNIKNVSIVQANSINPYIIANNKHIILEEGVLEEVANHFKV
jgi:large subunit ribosomal protein L4